MSGFFQPTFRSRRFGHRHLTARAIVKIGLTAWLAPALLGLVVAAPFLVVGTQLESEALNVIGGMAGLLAISPLYGIYAVPLALLFGAWFMRWGLAGWGMAVGVSLLGPVLVGLIFLGVDPESPVLGTGLFLSPFFVTHAVILWAATRYFCPDCLIE